MRCWVAPRDMRAGADWPAQIVEAIGSAVLMVLVLSEHANRSPQVLREVDRAVSHGVAVLAVRIGNFALSKNLEYFISMCHWLEAHEGGESQSLDDLCAHARAITTQGPAAALSPIVKPVPSQQRYGADLLSRVESELAMHIGPIARHLVRKAADQAVDREELFASLARELANDGERHEFLRRVRGLR